MTSRRARPRVYHLTEDASGTMGITHLVTDPSFGEASQAEPLLVGWSAGWRAVTVTRACRYGRKAHRLLLRHHDAHVRYDDLANLLCMDVLGGLPVERRRLAGLRIHGRAEGQIRTPLAEHLQRESAVLGVRPG